MIRLNSWYAEQRVRSGATLGISYVQVWMLNTGPRRDQAGVIPFFEDFLIFVLRHMCCTNQQSTICKVLKVWMVRRDIHLIFKGNNGGIFFSI